MSQWYDKKRKHWKAKFWFQNQPYYKGTFKTKRDAAKWEREKKSELENPQAPEIHITSLRDLATLYLDHCYATFQKNTCRAKGSYYRRFLAYLIEHTDFSEDDSTDAIPQYIYTKYLDHIARSDGKKNSNRHLKDLKAMFKWAVDNQIIDKHPVRLIEPKGEDQFVKYVPPVEDVNRVMLTADRDEMDFLICIYKPGARLSEILNLKWDDINLKIGSVRLWTRKRKGGGWQSRTLKMPQQMHEVLKRRYKNRNKESQYVFCRNDGKPFTRDCDWIREMMGRLCKRSNVKPFTFHAFRHRMSANLMDSGEATLGMIQEFLGHQRKTTTEDYLKALDRGAIDVANVIDAMDEGENQSNSEFGE